MREKYCYLLRILNQRKQAKKNCEFLGYIVPFDDTRHLNQAQARISLGYGKEPRIICSVGVTAVGKELLGLCRESFPL